MSYAALARKAPVVSTSRASAAVRPASGGLRIGDAHDAYEQEAERVADDIVMGTHSRHQWSLSDVSVNPALRRKCSCSGSGDSGSGCAECGKHEDDTMQRRATGPAPLGVAPPIVHDVLSSPGRPLDQDSRAFFEPRFGRDLSAVRIHTDAPAAQSAQNVNAAAYSVGSHVVFADRMFAPQTLQGRRLIAHELTHVLQQSGGRGSLGHGRLQRQPDPKLDAAAQKRLDTFALDAKDLSNPLVTGQLRSMSNSALVDYKNKVKDTDVKRYVETLVTFSTPLQAGAAVDPLSGDMTMKVGNVNVVIKPDVRGAKIKVGDTQASFTANPPRIPAYKSDKGVVIDFTDVVPVATVQIVTSYETGVSPDATSGYGRGTTADDVRNKATGLRFHEGSHGEDYIDFVRKNPYPVFTGKNGMKVDDFEKAKTTYNKAVADWGKALQKVKLQGDCVGTTIDQFHKGEKGYTNICP